MDVIDQKSVINHHKFPFAFFTMQCLGYISCLLPSTNPIFDGKYNQHCEENFTKTFINIRAKKT